VWRRNVSRGEVTVVVAFAARRRRVVATLNPRRGQAGDDRWASLADG
jgi:hypothetical protein